MKVFGHQTTSGILHVCNVPHLKGGNDQLTTKVKQVFVSVHQIFLTIIHITTMLWFVCSFGFKKKTNQILVVNPTLLFEALMKLVQLQWKSLLNKNLPSLMIYVHKNQCQLFHIGNGIIWLTNWITLVDLNSFRPINLFVDLICVSLKNTLYIKNTLSGVLAVSWGPDIFI